ncbi:hypothetical protein [Nocardia altamirensis]|uniref:hypothetical protein n=1 Tax=Nocardia altamirensis TaxID=472158 RepID=UPI0008409456|nr:hypothetical protein [Nocardia altamirensis]
MPDNASAASHLATAAHPADTKIIARLTEPALRTLLNTAQDLSANSIGLLLDCAEHLHFHQYSDQLTA